MANQIRAKPNTIKAPLLRHIRNLFARLSAASLTSRVKAHRVPKSAFELPFTEWPSLWDLEEAGPLSVTEMAAIQRTDHALISRAIHGIVRW
ncbi:hypothetical protein [Gymnodinialimonas ulvae]|uniref:hypothetical protein n=1 Tax=Gymnodinialimonas ulvae TaxID=3126504 RepID=UPI0030A55032